MKSLQFKNLQAVPVYIEDTYDRSPFYFNFINLPDKLALGKNGIRFSPNPNMLDLSYDITFEFIDSTGNVLYYEITPYAEEDELNLRLLSLHLYSNSPSGYVQMTVIGTATYNIYENTNIPREWKGLTNVRYTHTFLFEHTNKNETPVLFYQTPTVTISELRKPYSNRSLTVSSSVSSFTGSGYYYFKHSTPILELVDGAYTNDMIGGRITIVGNGLKPSNLMFPSYDYSTFSTKVTNLINYKTAVLQSPYTASLKNGKTVTFSDSNISTVYIEYNTTPVYTTTENYKSYLDVNVDNLNTVSGQVKKLRLYGRSHGGTNVYENLGDIDIHNNELLINTNSILDYDRRNVGYFINGTDYLTFWTFENISSSFNSGSLYNSIKLNTTSLPAQMTSNVSITYQEHSPYRINLNYLVDSPGGILKVYMSGSAFTNDFHNHGKLLCVLDTSTVPLNRQNLYIPFTADYNGTGVLKFVIDYGNWYISDISIKCDVQPGFTPSKFRTNIPINVKSRNDVYDFRVDLIDSLDHASIYEFNTLNSTISGSNFYLEGNDNLITGSMYASKTIGSGILIDGTDSIIKTSNFNGQSGWALWSGSRTTELGTESSGSGFYFETGPPWSHYIRAEAGGKVIINGDITGFDPGTYVSISDYNAFTQSVSSSYTPITVFNNVSQSFINPEFWANLFGITCNVDGSNNGGYTLKIRCENGVLTFATVVG